MNPLGTARCLTLAAAAAVAAAMAAACTGGDDSAATAAPDGAVDEAAAPANDAAVDVGRAGDVENGDAKGDEAVCTGGIPDPAKAPSSIDPSCLTATFADDFQVYDVSSGPVADGKYNGERWFNGTEQCCLSPSDGLPAANYPTPGPQGAVNPYSILPGGGLRISLQKVGNEWFSGVMTSIDKNGQGFAQQYGYFEASMKLAPGTGTWPAFWMLSAPGGPGGEIDVFEQYGCNPPLDPKVEHIFHTTLHDWSANPPTATAYTATVTPDLTADYHRYGLLWNATYIALYFDGQLQWSTPTLSVMKRPYYLLADMGMGSGWDTTQTPNPSNLDIRYIRAYSVPGF
jgi:hypothetical protein